MLNKFYFSQKKNYKYIGLVGENYYYLYNDV